MVRNNKLSRKSQTVTCTLCKSKGHNRRSCKGPSVPKGKKNASGASGSNVAAKKASKNATASGSNVAATSNRGKKTATTSGKASTQSSQVKKTATAKKNSKGK